MSEPSSETKLRSLSLSVQLMPVPVPVPTLGDEATHRRARLIGATGRTARAEQAAPRREAKGHREAEARRQQPQRSGQQDTRAGRWQGRVVLHCDRLGGDPTSGCQQLSRLQGFKASRSHADGGMRSSVQRQQAPAFLSKRCCCCAVAVALDVLHMMYYGCPATRATAACRCAPGMPHFWKTPLGLCESSAAHSSSSDEPHDTEPSTVAVANRD